MGMSFSVLNRNGDHKSNILWPKNLVAFCNKQIIITREVPQKIPLDITEENKNNDFAFLFVWDKTNSAEIDARKISSVRETVIDSIFFNHPNITNKLAGTIKKAKFTELLLANAISDMTRNGEYDGIELGIGVYYHQDKGLLPIGLSNTNSKTYWETVANGDAKSIEKVFAFQEEKKSTVQQTNFGKILDGVDRALSQLDSITKKTKKKNRLVVIFVSDLIHDDPNSRENIKNDFYKLKKNANIEQVKLIQLDYLLFNAPNAKKLQSAQRIKNLFELYFQDNFSEFNVLNDGEFLAKDIGELLENFIMPYDFTTKPATITFYNSGFSNDSPKQFEATIDFCVDDTFTTKQDSTLRSLLAFGSRWPTQNTLSLNIQTNDSNNERSINKLIVNDFTREYTFNAKDDEYSRLSIAGNTSETIYNNYFLEMYLPDYHYKKRFNFQFKWVLNNHYAKATIIILWSCLHTIWSWFFLCLLVLWLSHIKKRKSVLLISNYAVCLIIYVILLYVLEPDMSMYGSLFITSVLISSVGIMYHFSAIGWLKKEYA
ncbi:hypothetical protein [Spongiimicrobium salis]|uniref:hypothetical protein n=1 Tax=Spongiimicrobium salis TaxID=1667022 RepID=UPI00374DEBF2